MVKFDVRPVVPYRSPRGGQKFGPRTPPTPGASSNHQGIDHGPIAGKPTTTPLYSVARGTVRQNYWSNARGWVITITHQWSDNGVIFSFTTLYQHMRDRSPLAVGARVAAGDIIGIMGTTGISTGVHLHFELHVNNVPMNPEWAIDNVGKEVAMNYQDFVTFFNRHQTELGTLQPANNQAPEEFQQAIDMGLTDGNRPQQLPTRQQVAIMTKRAVEKALELTKGA